MPHAHATDLRPFCINHASVGANAIDLSFLLEKPAGKKGFISAKNGRLFESDGTRMKLWGVNITDWTRGSVQIPEKKDAILIAREIARYGINCVRLTFLDLFSPRGVIDPKGDQTSVLDQAQLDKLDFWISELKKNGIYSDLSLFVGRTYKKGDHVVDYDKIGWAKYASYFDPQLIKLQKDFAKQILTRYNPYTKTHYVDEPAIAIVELVNENTFFDAWYRDALHPGNENSQDANFRNLTNHYSDSLTILFNEYINKKYDNIQIQKIRTQACQTLGGLIPRARLLNGTVDNELWIHATIDFYVNVEKKYFIEMQSYLKDTLHLKSLILGSNDFLHNQSEYPMLYSNQELDIIDGHVYWQHPTWPGKINTPMVNEPDSSTIAKLSRAALQSKPFTVTEVNNAFPNEYDCEGIPLISAYGSFQDWDAIMVYTYEPKIKPDYKGYVGDAFDISHHPVKMPQMMAGALMYLRGDVKSANKTVVRSYSDKQIYQTMTMPVKESPYYTPGYPVSTVFKHKVRIGSLNKESTNDLMQTKEPVLLSDTKELSWELNKKGNGCVLINTPYSQGVIGFVNEFPIVTDNLNVKVENQFCSITLSSIDKEPINKTSQMLLIAGAKVENSGQVWDKNHQKVVYRGMSPSLIETVNGIIELKHLKNAKRIIVKPLDGSGVPVAESIEAEKIGDVWRFPIGGRIITTWYQITIIR